MVTKRYLLGLVAGSALAGGPAGASAAAADARYGGLVVFGDSLSDGGNAGRYSDGPVWVERMAERLGILASPLTDLLLHGDKRRYRSIDSRIVAAAAAQCAREKAQGRWIHDNDSIRRYARRLDGHG